MKTKKTEKTKAEKELLSALTWLLRVTTGEEYDDKDHLMAYVNAEKVIEKYSDEDDE